MQQESNGQTILPAPLSPNNSGQLKSDVKITLNDRRRIFRQIIVKCVLQLLLIEMTNDLLRNDEVYNTMPPEHLLRLMGVLDHSYQFARMFNEDKDLRTGLWKVGECIHLSLISRASSTVYRLHEAPTKPSQARVQQRVDVGSCTTSHVLRPTSGTSSCATSSYG